MCVLAGGARKATCWSSRKGLLPHFMNHSFHSVLQSDYSAALVTARASSAKETAGASYACVCSIHKLPTFSISIINLENWKF